MKKTSLILTLAMIMLSACLPAPASPTPDDFPSPPATEAQTENPVEQGNGCPVAAADMQLLMNEEDGYCLLYPAAYTVNPPRLIIINPVGAPGDVPGDAWVNIMAEPASGRTATQVADAQIAEAGEGFGITRVEILMGETQAIVVDGLPGPDSWRKVFVVANDRLYTMEFQPWFPSDDPSQPTPLENLYTTIVDTIHFLP